MNAHTTGNVLPTQVIGVAKGYVTDDEHDVLVTYSLGSCVGVTAYDPTARVGGMIHCLLPASKGNEQKATDNPFMYVDSGIIAFLNELCLKGAKMGRLIIKVAGAASSMDPNRRFRIGERNYMVLRKILWKNNLLIAAESVGGTVPRTMTLHMSSGRTTVKEGEEVLEL